MAKYKWGTWLEEGVHVARDLQGAASYIQRAADEGLARAQFKIAQWRDRDGDPEGAARYFGLAADQGHMEAEFEDGRRLEEGSGVAWDVALALEYYARAADQGRREAQFKAATLFEAAGKLELAAPNYHMATDAGHMEAQHRFGLYLYGGRGVPANEAEAARYFWMAADAGHASGQSNYGWCLYNGFGIPLDRVRAAEFFRLAVAQSDTVELFNYGAILDNEQAAADCFGRAARMGDAGAQFKYAAWLQKVGRARQAMKYFKRSARQNHVHAQYWRGIRAMKTDAQKAVEYFTKAAEPGHSRAQFRLVICLLDGIRVEMNRPEGENYVRKAAQQGNEKAKERLKNLRTSANFP
jgi:TPR repeat protein